MNKSDFTRHRISDRKLMKLINPQCTIMENLNFIKSKGYKISKDRICKFLKLIREKNDIVINNDIDEALEVLNANRQQKTIPTKYFNDFDIKYKMVVDTTKAKKRKSDNKISIEINDEFFDDFMHISFSEFVDTYRAIYPHVQHTPFNRDNSKPYTVLPDNFIYIRHKYCDEVYNGDVVGTNLVKLKDGQHRRKALYMCAIMRRLMIPDITIEHLLANAYYDLNYYISNAIDPINRYELTEICVRAYAADISKYDINTFKDKKQPKFIINDDYCAQNGISKKQALNISRKLLNYERIGEVYDPSLSLNENLKQMSELGVKVSKPTLILFKKFYDLY